MKCMSSLKDWTIYNQNKVKEKTSNRQFSFFRELETGNLSQIKNKQKYIYNEEFDPGSGWTLATGLTHASRGAAWN